MGNLAHFWHTPGLTEIEAQKHWEVEGTERGVRRARAELDGQKVADSALGSALAQRAVPALIELIEAAQKEAEAGLADSATRSRGKPTTWWYLILLLPADKLAVITVKKTMSFHPRDFTFNPALTGLASDINAAIRDQLDYEEWRGADKATVDRFFANYELSPRNLKRLRERLGKKREERWDTTVGIQFGVLLLQMLAQAVPEWFRVEQARLRGGRWEYQFVFTEEAREALFKISQQCELSQPALMPMICPPADWRVAA